MNQGERVHPPFAPLQPKPLAVPVAGLPGPGIASQLQGLIRASAREGLEQKLPPQDLGLPRLKEHRRQPVQFQGRGGRAVPAMGHLALDLEALATGREWIRVEKALVRGEPAGVGQGRQLPVGRPPAGAAFGPGDRLEVFAEAFRREVRGPHGLPETREAAAMSQLRGLALGRPWMPVAIRTACRCVSREDLAYGRGLGFGIRIYRQAEARPAPICPLGGDLLPGQFDRAGEQPAPGSFPVDWGPVGGRRRWSTGRSRPLPPITDESPTA